ncbi:MAG TPA: DnaJ domain-containing protein, partial [Nitrospiraceae bacterium]|nr:DnaJ domain-containing protein [Nitrospiraceae bacterium]
MKDYYAILEILQTASTQEVRQAWREQLQIWHPDRFAYNLKLRAKAECKTKEINEAYEVLSDPIKRRTYDVDVRGTPKAEEGAAHAKTIVRCQSCGVNLSFPNKGLLRIRCKDCGHQFIYDSDTGATHHYHSSNRTETPNNPDIVSKGI